MSMMKRIIAARPCDGPLYDDWTETDFYLKVCEEHGEVGKAFARLRAAERSEEDKAECMRRWWKLMEECTDNIVALTSFMNRCGCNEDTRQRLMSYVNNHNGRRDDGRRFRKTGDDQDD
ncbi:hypothetical protein [uncultured Mitsuokella sp.]|uniref:hypothetical protein n=1 Tax=uncultured Mitsuokella sp. TaxID=453120 RepID=UPI00267061FD|nr:hypothetical protein [uncultured Mitsuokella sp.]